MNRPTEEELIMALKSARLMRERNNDPFHLGKTLLYYRSHIRFLEEVENCAEAYLHSGLPDSGTGACYRPSNACIRRSGATPVRKIPRLGYNRP